MTTVPIRPLSAPLNTNYDPPQPWACATHAAHACAGPVVGAVGAYPVCAAGATAEQAARAADAERIARLMADPAFVAQLEAEAAAEQRWERRVS